MARRWLVALCALLLPAPPLLAQVVVGTVRDRETRQPVQGAMVRLMAGTAPTGVLYLTGTDGHFNLEAPAAGRYTLAVERIGFASTTAGPVDLERGKTRRFDLDVATSPIRLEGLQVRGAKRRCNLEDDPGGETQLLWSEVRKALDAEQWTERKAGLAFELEQRTVILDASGRRVLDEQRRTTTAFGGNSMRTLSPAELAEKGYVHETKNATAYYGPDASVLLSDAFLATHCFSVVEGPRGEPGLIGLAFEPVSGRRVPDIQGVLWLERATARLERLEFEYSGLRLRPGHEQARGALHFTELSDGRWMVRDWNIRAPFLRVDHTFVGGQMRGRTVVGEVREQGSRVLSAKGPDVDWRAPDRGGGG
ncbi:MAG: carboxypeptidase-like regulatory domain-containing protein [Gemmatimonadetes bacterium]|nr:carboxypeptidase-like regulatory domain-containing protein [Gemmatimonadota bacterium]